MLKVSSMQFYKAGCALVATMWVAGCGGGISVPPAPTDASSIEQQAQSFVETMKPRRPGKPIVVVLAVNEGTEMTDFLLPHAVLQRSGVVDVHAVAPQRGPVHLYPALDVEVNEDLASFDQANPSGADYVIVPAMSNDNHPAATGWLKQQAEKGARIIGVCAGALVVANAGLLDGRRFVTHWYYRDELLEQHPTAEYVPHQRYLVDRDVATTTGITASVPMLIALVEAIAGRDRAQLLAEELGVESWSPRHDSSQFGLNGKRRWNYIVNKVAFWQHERWSVDVKEGMDDVALALAADAWSRTGRVSIDASAAGPVKLGSGMTLVARPTEQQMPRMPLEPSLKSVQQLDRTLCDIAERFGDARQDRVRMELEYPKVPSCGA
jgi:transcriptional regulator GlxA family with amidase domain